MTKDLDAIKETLKPCPVCGCNASWNPKETTKKNGPVTYDLNLGFVECIKSCLRTPGLVSKGLAFKTWNIRTTPVINEEHEQMTDSYKGTPEEWTSVKKALWNIIVGAKLNTQYTNTWKLTKQLYEAVLANETKPNTDTDINTLLAKPTIDMEPVTRWVPRMLTGEAVMQTTSTHEGRNSYVKFTDHQAQVDTLQAKVDQLKNELNELKKETNQHE